MGGRHLLKGVGTLDHIKQMSDESLDDFYNRFNKELAEIGQFITVGKTIHAFVRALLPRVSALYDSLNVIMVKTVEEMAAWVKSYIDMEIAKEGRKTHKETKKEIQERKRPEQRSPKAGHDD